MYRGILFYFHSFPKYRSRVPFNYYPAFMGLYRSFFEWDVGLPPKFVGLGNFIELFTKDEVFQKSLGNVTILTLWRVVSGVTIPFLVAEMIFNLRNQVSQYTYRVLMILPTVVPGIDRLSHHEIQFPASR